MTSGTKSFLLLALTLIVGFTLGLFADTALVRSRRERINRMGRPPGLVAHLERVIQPRDSVQAAAIRPLLQSTVDSNEEVIRQANARLRANMDSLRTALEPTLDASQRERLARELRRLPQMGGPGFPRRGRNGGRSRRGGTPPATPAVPAGSSATQSPTTRP